MQQKSVGVKFFIFGRQRLIGAKIKVRTFKRYSRGNGFLVHGSRRSVRRRHLQIFRRCLPLNIVKQEVIFGVVYL
jgi:hypothetical protein